MKKLLSVLALSACFITPSVAESDDSSIDNLQHDRMVLGLSYISPNGSLMDGRGNRTTASTRVRSTQQHGMRMRQPAYMSRDPAATDAIEYPTTEPTSEQ